MFSSCQRNLSWATDNKIQQERGSTLDHILLGGNLPLPYRGNTSRAMVQIKRLSGITLHDQVLPTERLSAISFLRAHCSHILRVAGISFSAW